MPAANPMAEVISFGGEASGSAGPISARTGGSVAVDDHHISASVALVALVVLALLWRGKFRFSMTTSGG